MGGSAEFAISAGGFHPRYDPPRELAGMQRLGMDLSPPAILTLRAESYFALTSNSVQLGSRVEMGADLGVASISGHFAFDALVLFSPRFMFMIDLGIGLTVRAFGVTLCGVSVQLHLEGPAPWRAEGHAEVEILWWDIPVDVGPFTWGDDDNPPPLPADPRQLVRDALHRNPGAWQALTPPDADRVVRLVPAPPSDTDVTVHPMGLFDVRQHAVPLETVDHPRRRQPGPRGPAAGPPRRAAGQRHAGGRAERGHRPVLGRQLPRPQGRPEAVAAELRADAGRRADPPARRGGRLRRVAGTPSCATRPSSATTTPRGVRGRALVDVLWASAAALALASGAAGASELRARTRYAIAPDPIVLADPGEVCGCPRRP